MREIKFRAWDNVLKCFDSTVAANLLMQLHDEDEDLDEEYGKRFFLMQFTGLHDKNGKEIYEGDFVKHDAWNYPFKVVFNQHKARFVCELKSGLTQYIDYQRIEVMGNIYENPELVTPTP